MTGQIWMHSEPTGTHRKRQQVLRYNFFILIWTACAQLVTLLLMVSDWSYFGLQRPRRVERTPPSPPPPPPPPRSVTPRYKSYGRSILRILRSFQFWVYLAKLLVFSGILSTFLGYIGIPLPPWPTLLDVLLLMKVCQNERVYERKPACCCTNNYQPVSTVQITNFRPSSDVVN